MSVCVLFDSKEDASRAPTGDITLAYCSTCGLVQNRTFEPSKLAFAPGYDASLRHSATFRNYIEGLASRLVDKYELRGRTIGEIGCGDGHFLRLLCEYGANHGVGFDPTISTPGISAAGKGDVRLVREPFSDKFSELGFDFLCCLSVLEALVRPVDFLETIRLAADAHEAPTYLEVLNAGKVFDEQDVWSPHYEQCNYFTLESLTRATEEAGFEVIDRGTSYGTGEYLFVEARPATMSARFNAPRKELSLPEPIQSLSDRQAESIRSWNRRMSDWRRQSLRTVVWGSGGKGISFLNQVSTHGVVEYVVDINPNRQGKYVPSSAQRIVGPEFLVQYAPDKIVITNPLYESEIRRSVAALGVSCDFILTSAN